jgi:hypothetical protein
MCDDQQRSDDLRNDFENLDEIIAEECSEHNFQKIKKIFKICLASMTI